MAYAEHEGIINISQQASATCSQFSCNNEFIALPATSNEIGISRLDEADRMPVHLRRHLTDVTAICFGHQKNPTYLCTASDDSILIWQLEQTVIDYKTGRPSDSLQIAKELGRCSHLCFSPDDVLLSACIDKEVWIINIETCELVATLTGHDAVVTASIFCPHQLSTFVTISEDRTFKIWDIKDAMLLYQSPVISSSPFWSIAMHPEHMHFSVGSGDGKIRVFDLISHRCIHEVDVANAVSKMDMPKEAASLSSESDVTISSLAEWKRRQQDVFAEVSSNNEDTDAELTYSVISLAYWREMLAADENGTVKSNPLINYDDTVREVLKDPPLLIAGCTSLLVLFDANTMNAVYHLDLMRPMTCFKGLEPVEYCVSSAGSFAFAISEDTSKIHCLVQSLFQSNVHLITMQPKRAHIMHSDERHSISESDIGGNDTIPNQLSVLSSVPVMAGSPLMSVLEERKSDPKTKAGEKVSQKDKKLNQPLTFKSKVKSSGYSESPRSKMFQPKTNAPAKKGAPARKASTILKEKCGLITSLTSDSYPTKSNPPVQLKDKFNLPPKPTSINSMKFSVDGKHLSCALGDKNAFILKMPFSGKVSSFAGHNNAVNTADMSHSTAWLLTSSNDRTAKLWTPNQSSPLLNISRIKHNFKAEKVTPSSEQDNPVFPKEISKAAFYYVDKFILLSCLNTLYMYKYNIGETKTDIKRYQTAHRYKLVKQFEIENAQHITTFSSINGFYSYIVMAACTDKSVAVFDMNVGAVMRRMDNLHERNVHTICQNQGSPFVTHPSEAYDLFITSAATDGIKLWDLRAERCVRKFDGHVNRSHSVGVAYSPCSRFIATGSEDRSAYVFDIRNSAYLHRLPGHSDVVSCVDFHPETPMLATGCLDGRLQFYADAL